jgi:hypothetical protein
MFDTLFSGTPEQFSGQFVSLLAGLCCSFLLGLFISFVYMKSQGIRVPGQSFIFTLVMLPSIVTAIIFLIGTNLASAFGLAGAFAIIRFRSAAADHKDITYILFCMAVGLASGKGMFLYAVIIAIMNCGLMFCLEYFRFDRFLKVPKKLKIVIPENLNYQNAFDDVLKKYTHAYRLTQVRTIDLGSLFELDYAIVVKEGLSEKELLDELRCRNGNMSITLILDEQSR